MEWGEGRGEWDGGNREGEMKDRWRGTSIRRVKGIDGVRRRGMRKRKV